MELSIKSEEALRRFIAALGIDTTSPHEGSLPEEAAKLLDFQDFILSSFPVLVSQSECIRPSPFALAFRLPANQAPLHNPVLFTAHYDVVPADPKLWQGNPFEPSIESAYLRARGTLDTKNTLMALLEAVEDLCTKETPRHRDIYLAFGGDEELRGTRGAGVLASEFAKRGLCFDWVHDEGGIVAQGVLAGVSEPLGLIGIAEKGFCNIRLRVAQASGHASRPPRVQAAAVLGAGLQRLGRGVFKARLLPSVADFFSTASRHMKGPLAFVLAQARLFQFLLLPILQAKPETAAMVKSTLALTQLQGSSAANVLPNECLAICNIRILPGDTVDSCLHAIRKALRPWPAIQADLEPASLACEAVGESSTLEWGYKAVSAALVEAFPSAIPVPYLNTARTDSSAYANISKAIYRFAPMTLTKDELGLIHGDNERISLENYFKGLEFYTILVQKAARHE